MDLTGKRFGKLVVIKKLEERENNYCVWLCRCDCGNTVKVNTRHLKYGTVTNCGCIQKKTARRGTKAEDLTGQVFGKLHVLDRADNHCGRPAWLCQCECGSRKIVTAHDLKAGKVKSCGSRSCRGRKELKNLTGMKFGRLTALYPTERRDRKGSVYWHCLCDCGNTIEVSVDNLMWGNYQSCGCLKYENYEKISQRLHHVDGTCVEFLEKRRHRKDNSSGFCGVFHTKNNKYRAYIGFQGKRYTLGTYDSFDKAVEVRIRAEKQIYGAFLDSYYEWKEKAEKNPDWAENNPLRFHVEKAADGEIIVSRQ